MKPTGKALQVRKPTLPVVRPSIALALGGGGARGLAHILMLEVFDELGLKPTVIAGTSIGAIFGAAYASGLSARLIRAHTEETLSQRFEHRAPAALGARPSRCSRSSTSCPIRAALLKPEALLDHLLPSKVARDFAHLQIPLKVVATDFYAQEQVVIERGRRCAARSPPASPCRRSSRRSRIDGRLLMDGGLVNPLPFDLLDGEADITVAIDVSGASTGPGKRPQPSAFAALMSSSQILQRSIVREKLKARQPDIYIDVEVDEFYVLDFHRFKRRAGRGRAGQGAPASASSHRVLASQTAEALPAVAPAEPPAMPAAAQAAPARPQAADARAGRDIERRRARASAWRSAAARRAGLPMC